MDDERPDDTLDTAIGPRDGPGSLTGMETTVSGGLSPENDGFGFGRDFRDDSTPSRRAVDLSFLAPSTRAGSLGRVGEYEIVAVLGRGSVGIVLKGLDRGLDRFVAVKVQDPCLALNRRVRARFLREARAVAAISDPRVVTIHKVNAVKDQPYLVMEFVSGSLRDKIKAEAPLATIEVVQIAEQIALGLAAAHDGGVLHRDIKPANILLDEAKRVKISDFGLAIAGVAASALSTEKIAGTPGYMSPEQSRGEPLDGRSDLFSLGCVTHAMLAGHSPFPGENTAAILKAVCERAPEPLPVPAGCPVAAGVADIVSRLLAKDRNHRPSSAKEVAEQFAALRSVADVQAAPSAQETAAEPAAVSGPTEIIPLAPMKTITWPGLTAVSIALLSFSCLILSMFPSPEPRPTKGGTRVWTVGRSPTSHFADLPAALEKVTPGTTLILTDPGPHHGPFILDDPEKFRDVTIESAEGATLSAVSGESVVTIHDVPGITLRNLTIEPAENQFAVDIAGKVEGTRLDQLRVSSPETSRWTQIYLRLGATGSATKPIVISGSTFRVGHGAITIEGQRERSIGHVEILGNRFLGDDEQIHVLQNAHDIAIKGNIFVGGQCLTINLGRSRGRSILVTNNTFFRPETWLHPADSHPQQDGIEICNNAILESNEIDVGNQDLTRMERGGWRFHHNLWEPGLEATRMAESPLAQPHPKLEVVSRDPDGPGYLQPAELSILARSGAGDRHARHVGALPPVGTESESLPGSGTKTP